jgi:hypothetical protein
MMTLKDAKMSKQGTACKRKHITLTISQNLEIIRRLESAGNQREVMASYNIEVSTTSETKK